MSFKYLFYGSIEERFINKYLKNNDCKVIDITKIKIIKILKLLRYPNFFFKIIKSLFLDGVFLTYVLCEILKHKPKIVLTTRDNDIRFYKLKKYFPQNTKFFVIQNGLRSKFHDIFDNKQINDKDLAADIFFSFGTNLANHLIKFIKVKVVNLGSYKSNMVKLQGFTCSHLKKPKILYISGFRLRDKNDIFEKTKCGKNVYWRNVYESDLRLAKLVQKYCISKKLKFSVLCTLNKKNNKEINFFKKHLVSENLSFLSKKIFLDSYKIIDKYDIIVTSESTLGYEALGRNKKVAFFKKNITPYDDWRYGWPKNYLKKGLFYSDKTTIFEVDRVLTNLIRIKKNDWKSILIKEKRLNMQFNFNNSLLKKYI